MEALENLPILYSFRRCPYAMRARFALKMAGIACCLREISLKEKPDEMLKISPKGTVPILQLPEGRVIDQSIEIIRWAFRQNIPQDIGFLSENDSEIANDLIEFNDDIIVKIIHRYKYTDFYPLDIFQETKKELEIYLKKLDMMLESHQFLLADKMNLADIAIFPFIRQVAQVDQKYFRELGFLNLSRWLNYFLHHPLFAESMAKYPLWSKGSQENLF